MRSLVRSDVISPVGSDVISPVRFDVISPVRSPLRFDVISPVRSHVRYVTFGVLIGQDDYIKIKERTTLFHCVEILERARLCCFKLEYYKRNSRESIITFASWNF